jgi:hypothetical protein
VLEKLKVLDDIVSDTGEGGRRGEGLLEGRVGDRHAPVRR